jgi:hypothetical protein
MKIAAFCIPIPHLFRHRLKLDRDMNCQEETSAQRLVSVEESRSAAVARIGTTCHLHIGSAGLI